MIYLFKTYRICSVALLMLTSMVVAGCATPVGEVAAWPITNAQENQFSGEVVDVLCELNGNCAENCGAGKRQLGIKTESGSTILVAKNLNNYSGGTDELLEFCAQPVEVNGLFTNHQGVRFFQVQNVRAPGGQWRKATRYLEAWSERSGKPASGRWYANDDRVREILERDGRLGLGLEADQEYFK